MPRTCTVCTNPEREDIDRALVARTSSYRDIARQYGVSKDAIGRHVKEHLPELLARGYEAERVLEADKLLTDVKKLQIHTLNALLTAESAQDWNTMLKAVREARANIALLFEAEGRIDRRLQINLVVSPEWIELRAVIVDALEAHPAARSSVVRAIEATASLGRAGNGHS